MSQTEKFVAFLEKHKRTFYHFTDERNIGSIKAHGILSTAKAKEIGIKPITGGNQWSLDADASKGMDKYVHLCFFSSHPMEYIARSEGRIQSSKFLTIKPSIIRMPGAMISTDVSNKAAAVFGSVEEFIDKIDLQVMYTRTDWNNSEIKERLKAAKKCEVLILGDVPTEYIENI